MSATDSSPSAAGPLEKFLHDYLETMGGLWEQVEPQVYDLMLPDTPSPGNASAAASENIPGSASLGRAVADSDRGVVRAVFDPDALPEHPGSQFMTLGTPLMDALLTDAQRRGCYARAYVSGLNLAPFDLPKRVRRALDLTEGLVCQTRPHQPVEIGIAVFWFLATFVSDQKEQTMFPVAIDLHHGRQIRHLDQLCDPGRLSESALEPLPAADRKTMAEAYKLGREQAVRSAAAVANQRRRELDERFERHAQRMARYYQDLLDETRQRAVREKDPAVVAARRQAIERERDLRLAELRQKSTLRVHIRLSNLLLCRQPKLVVPLTLAPAHGTPVELSVLWDPLVESLEPPECPRCGRSTFALRTTTTGSSWVCPQCVTTLHR